MSGSPSISEADTSEVRVASSAGVLTLTLDRPARRNALSTVTMAELIHLIGRAREDASVRVLVLRGAGKGFCPGDDLSGMGKLPDDFPLPVPADLTHAALQRSLRELPKPTIAAIHGFAFGVGLDLAMACDFRIAAADAQLRDQRVMERGMHAVTGCAWFQPRAIGVTRAFEFLVLGEPLTGEQAAAAGMVTRSVAADQLDAQTAELAERLARAPTRAIGLMKRQIYTGLQLDHGAFMEFAAPLIREVEIKDREEGINAFLEKRPPNFTGE